MTLTIFIISIIYFFLLLFSLGFSLIKICKIELKDDWFVSLNIYLGTGLCVLIFLSIVFDIIGLPLHYTLFFFMSLIFFGYSLWKYGFRPSFSWKKEYIYEILVLISVIILFMTFYKGAFAYPYLEDDDPWGHAMAVKYIANEKTYNQDEPELISHYLEPYPPTYDVIMALMYQINGTIFYTLKIFNIILIALGMLFFFVFVLELFGVKVASVATLVLVALPSYMSHFIWSHTLGLVLFFPAMFAAVQGFSNKRWMIVAIICIAAEMVAHPFVSVLFGIFYVVFVLWNITNRERFVYSIVIGFFGFLLGLMYWVQQVIRHGFEAVLYSHSGGLKGHTTIGAVETVADLYINPVYGFKDFLIAPIYTTIDQPTGFGIFSFVLVSCGVLYLLLNWKKYITKYHFIILVWLCIGFFGLLGPHIGFSILAHRFWAYASIPFAIIVGIFVAWLLERIWQQKLLFYCISAFLFITISGIPFTTNISLDLNPTYNTTTILSDIKENPVAGIITAINIFSSWQPKKIVETMQWPPGIDWSSVPELEGYMWMHDTLKSKKVFSLCKEERFLIGFDLKTAFPNKKTDAFRKNIATASVEEITSFVSGYDYVSLEYSCVKKAYLTEEQLNVLANQLAEQYSVLYQNDEIVVYSR